MLAGAVLPALALVAVQGTPAPILAVGMMGAGMIAAAIAGRLSIGLAAALVTGLGLLVLAMMLGGADLSRPAPLALAMFAAAASFAARGSLFARSGGERGWWIALFVVAGEAAMLATAAAVPGRLPSWLLALLPAQWASTAIFASLGGTVTRAALTSVVALAGTALTTLLVAHLWPRRWPYAVMFTAWLAASALVFQAS